MHFSRSAAAAAFVASLPAATLAQTFTDCDATKESCPPEVGLPSAEYFADFTQGSDAASSFSEADGTSLNFGSDGAEFTISRAGQAPTIGSDFMILFGRVEVVMKAAHGTGIVSSIVLESGVLDEIDWEFLGSNPTEIQSNYYGLANTTTYDRVGYHTVPDTQADFHSYTIDWTPEQMDFLVDGASVRTVPRASTEGRNYPQTPMQIKLGNWAAGGPGMPEGTVEWAGGSTNFDEGPFNMVVRSVRITNYNPACSYVYSDRSGTDDSIDIITSGDACNSGEVANPSSGAGSSSAASSSSAATSASQAASSSAISTTASVASPTATVAPTSSQGVDGIVPTAYQNTTAPVRPTVAPSASYNSTGSSTGSAPSATEVFDGGAALNSMVTGASLLVAAAGFWLM